ncbi:serine--tRNA ligase [Desulfonatronospira sp. MSAO_Bac3]|uniref:serine--tRNA ligase n=1 Tax=Desulfonatronospira sp. MSAO_Bac3 TaxID=2293857 RepID=UPI000FEE7A43|nr:serine--tRNA ligase [Desulfonatronospira sp. MSAO_Bac3]RQD77787.1 MAG: serine--tRNA ligase [Desulfonatronospira sp. MSAO_Bac3]
MLDIKFVRKNPDLVAKSIKDRGAAQDLDDFLKLEQQRRELTQRVQDLKTRRNQASQEVALAKREGRDAAQAMEGLSELSDKIKELDGELKGLDRQVHEWLLSVPNIPAQDVPVGSDEDDNQVVRTWGEKPVMDFQPREHWDLGVELGGLDFEHAAKMTGSRFVMYVGWGARLERALINFMLDVQTGEHGYMETMPPMIVNRDSMTATGQLPKFADDLFKLENWEYYLIPTAEVPLTNIHRGEVLQEDQLPLAYTAFTGCFRSEAGSHGKDTRGIIRQHQFNKVELVRFAHPDDSFEQLELLLGHAEEILKRLGLHYRVVNLCTGDLGFGAAKTYDIEVWLPGQGKYREISSCSNFTDFQARRGDIRFKPAQEKKSRLVHTLNGSGLAVGRALVAIMENCQQKDGSIVIPEVLRPYTGGMDIIRKP